MALTTVLRTNVLHCDVISVYKLSKTILTTYFNVSFSYFWMLLRPFVGLILLMTGFVAGR